MTKLIRVLAAGLVLTSASTAQATLIGDTVTCSTSGFVINCTTPTAVVTPAPEFTVSLSGLRDLMLVNIGASSITFDALTDFSLSATGSAILLGSLDDSAGDIVGIANFSTSDTIGIDASDVTFTAHTVRFNVDDSAWSPAGLASFDLLVSGPAAAVAEPATLALVGIGLGLFGVSGKRRRMERVNP